jgi:hypothetical protein
VRALVVAAALLTGCGGWGTPECADDGECEGIAVCDTRTNLCREVECTSSSQCDLGSHCDAVEHACVPGCEGNEDCIAGETCNFEHQCEPYGCRTTELDCHYGENCVSGECVDNPDPHCAPAMTVSAQNMCVNAGGALACFDQACSQIYCLLPCSTSDADPCPRGTRCMQPFNPTDDNGFYCAGDCEFLLAHGF